MVWVQMFRDKIQDKGKKKKSYYDLQSYFHMTLHLKRTALKVSSIYFIFTVRLQFIYKYLQYNNNNVMTDTFGDLMPNLPILKLLVEHLHDDR